MDADCDLRKAARPPGHCRYALVAYSLRALLGFAHFLSSLGIVGLPWIRWAPELLPCCDVLVFLTIRHPQPLPEALYAAFSLAALALLCAWHAAPYPAHPHLSARPLRALAAHAAAMAATVYMATVRHGFAQTHSTAGAHFTCAADAVAHADDMACATSCVGGEGVGTRNLVEARPGHAAQATAASQAEQGSAAVVGSARQGAAQTEGGAECGGATGDRGAQQDQRGGHERKEWEQGQVRLDKQHHAQEQKQQQLAASRAALSPRDGRGYCGEHQGRRSLSLNTLTLTLADGLLDRELRGGPLATATAAARDDHRHRRAGGGGSSSGGNGDPGFSFPLWPNSHSSPEAVWGVAREALGSPGSVHDQSGGPELGADEGYGLRQQGELEQEQGGGELEAAGGLARMCEAASPWLPQHARVPPVEPVPRVRVERHPLAETREDPHAAAPEPGPSQLPYLNHQEDLLLQSQSHRQDQQLMVHQQQQLLQGSLRLPPYRSSMRYHTLAVKIPDARPDQLVPNFEQLLDAEIKRVTGGGVPGVRGMSLGRLREVAVRPGCIELGVVTERWCGGDVDRDAGGVAGCFRKTQHFDGGADGRVDARADRQLVHGSGSGGGAGSGDRASSGPGVAVAGLRTLLLLQHQQQSDTESHLGAAAFGTLEGNEDMGAAGRCEEVYAAQALAASGGTAPAGLTAEVHTETEQEEQLLALRRPRLMAPVARVGSGRRHSDSSGAGAQPVLAAPTTPRVAPSVLCVHPRVLQLPPAAPPSAQAARQRNPPSSRRARHSTGSVALLGDLAAIRDHGGKSGYRRHSVCMSSSSNSAGRDAVLGDGGDGEELDVLADCGGMCLPVGVRRVLLWGAHGQDAQQQQQQQQQQQEGKQQRDQQPSGQEETREEGLGQGAAVVRVVVVPPESVWSGSHDARAAAEAEDEVQVMPVRDGEWEQGAGAQGGAAVTLVRGRRMAAQRHQHEDGGARCYEVVLWGLGAAAWGTRTRGSCFAGILLHLRWRGRPFCCVPLLLTADPWVAAEVGRAADTWQHAPEDLDQLLMDLATWGRHVAAHTSPRASHSVSPAASPSYRHTRFAPPPPSSPALGNTLTTAAALDAAAPETAWGPAPDPSLCLAPDLASRPSPFNHPWSCLDPWVSLSHHHQYQQAAGGPAGPAVGPWPGPYPWPAPDPRVSLALGGDLLSYARACGWGATGEALARERRRLAGALGVAGGEEEEGEEE